MFIHKIQYGLSVCCEYSRTDVCLLVNILGVKILICQIIY